MKELFFLVNAIKDMRPNAYCCRLKRIILLYFRDFVNEFTYIRFILPLKGIYNAVFIRPRAVMPLCTIRRVHVMPWATPIRRIGKTRKGYLCPYNNVSSGKNRYIKDGRLFPKADALKFFYFNSKTTISNKKSKVFSLSIKRRNYGGVAWMAKDKL